MIKYVLINYDDSITQINQDVNDFIKSIANLQRLGMFYKMEDIISVYKGDYDDKEISFF